VWRCTERARRRLRAVDAGAPDAATIDAPLRDGVSVLAGPDDDFALGDLEPLGAIVGDAELVGIGESVHTTGGQIRMRARMIRWLVVHAEVREIVLESPRTAIETRTEPYVQRCEGDAEEAMTGLHSIWWDRSTPALLTWLCTWNAEHPAQRVHVRGVDIRQPWEDAPALRDFYASHAPARAPLADAMSRCLGATYTSEVAFFSDPTVLRHYGEGGTLATPEDDHLACLEAADAVLADLAAHRSELVLASSERDVELARLAAVSMRAFDETIYHLSRGDLVNGPRDAAMADVLLTLRRLDPPSGRACSSRTMVT
jgi:erythromycin esterase-like protein